MAQRINVNSAVLNVVVGFESPDPNKSFPAVWTLNPGGVINLIPTGSHTTPTIEGSRLINSGIVWGSVTGAVALAFWAIDEILRGVNPLRRILGAAVLTFVAIRLLAAAL